MKNAFSKVYRKEACKVCSFVGLFFELHNEKRFYSPIYLRWQQGIKADLILFSIGLFYQRQNCIKYEINNKRDII